MSQEKLRPLPEFKPHRKLVKKKAGLEPERIGCSACGAPIDVRNPMAKGIITCQSCGAVIDLDSPDHTVLKKLALDKRPPSVLQLGAKGKLAGAEYEVIGRIKMKQTDEEGTYYWDEYLLFSPKSGYAWLQEESGHWMLFKKAKKKPLISARKSPIDKRFNHLGENYVVWERARAITHYVEGEFPYHAEVGDSYKYMTAIAPPFMLAAEWTENEVEWLLGQYVSHESVKEWFGLESIPEPQGVGTAQPYEWPPEKKQRTAIVAAFAALFMAATIFVGIFYSGDSVTRQTVPQQSYVQTAGSTPFEFPPFQMESGLGKMVLQMPANAPGWSFLRLTFRDSNGRSPIDFTARVDANDRTTKLFKVSSPGEYTLRVTGEMGGGQIGDVTIQIYEKVWLLRYFFIGALILSIFVLFELGTSRVRFEAKREES